jgi:uncharacterized protein involved in copper resistance
MVCGDTNQGGGSSSSDMGEAIAVIMGMTGLTDLEFHYEDQHTYVDAENWYGKIQYNAIDGKADGIDYYGSDITQVLISAKRVERIVNGKTNQILMTKIYTYPIAPLKNSVVPAKQDSGILY